LDILSETHARKKVLKRYLLMLFFPRTTSTQGVGGGEHENKKGIKGTKLVEITKLIGAKV
jgi:hypothetical protein